MVVLVNQLWVSSDPRSYNQKPPAHRREASVASSLSPLILRLSPSFPKKPGRSFVPFFLLPRSNSPRLGLVRNALPAAPVLTILSLSNLQLGPAPTQHLSIILPFPHSTTKLSLTHPIHRANNNHLCHATTRLSKHWRPRLLQEQLACSKPRKADFTSDNFTITFLPPLETALNILTLNDRQIGS